MTDPRARRALRAPLAVRVARIAIPAAVVGVVTTGVIVAVSPGQTQVAYPAPVANVASPYASTSASAANRHQAGSRAVSSARPSVSASPSRKATAAPKAQPKTQSKAAVKAVAKPKAKPKPKPKPAEPLPALKVAEPLPALKVTGKKYATVALNLRTQPKQNADVVAVVKAGSQLSVTDSVRDGYRFVSVQGRGRWVKNQYLADKKPKPAATSGGISSKPCKSGSQVESGLTPDAIKVHRAICARYPQVAAFGGVRSGGGNHGSGRAVDNMISNAAVGQQLADWVRAHSKQLGVSEVIYRQRIWTVQRSS